MWNNKGESRSARSHRCTARPPPRCTLLGDRFGRQRIANLKPITVKDNCSAKNEIDQIKKLLLAVPEA